MKYALIAISVLVSLFLVFFFAKILPLLIAKPTIKVDYVAEYNKITKPQNYDPDNNAAPLYQKAFETLTEMPEEIKDKLKAWRPVDLNDTELKVVKNWVNENAITLGYLKQAADKPYYWLKRHSQGDDLFNIEMPKWSNFRTSIYLINLQAKSMACEANIESALKNTLDSHKIGLHMSGPVTLVEQLIGAAICAITFDTIFAILDRVEINSRIMTRFQDQLEQQLQKSKQLNFSIGEKIFSLDMIQRSFTDDGNGDGKLIPGKLIEGIGDSPLCPSISYPLAILISLKNPSRNETVQTVTKLYKNLDNLAQETPWQQHQKATSYEAEIRKISKDNFFLQSSANTIGRVCEILQRTKIHGKALITTIAILRYKADKGDFPETLQQLVSAGYLKELPMDPYSDGPLVYKRTNNDFKLYSLGVDLSDDGGIPSRWGEYLEEKGGDKVFWPVEKFQLDTEEK